MGILSAIRGDSGPEPTAVEALLEQAVVQLAAMSANEEIFQERINELELSLSIEDREWSKIGSGMGDGFQFTREALDDLVHLSRLYAIKNPVIKRPVNLQAIYVWGQGVSIFAEGVLNDIVQAFLADPANRRSFSGHDAMMDMERRQRVEGNLFLRFFTTPSSGRVRVRRLPMEEMRAVVHNPEDRDEPWFYIRKFKKGETEHAIAYPDWRFARQRKMDKAGGTADEIVFTMPSTTISPEIPEDINIEWETPVMHRKTGGFGDMDFGVPETYAAIDWARAYREALQDYKKTIKSLATWAWKMKMGGGNAQLAAAAQALGTTFGVDGSTTETNPTPTAGSMMAYTGDMDFRSIDVSKAAVNPDGFRRLLLMAAGAMDMPEVYYGAAEGTFATAKAMDRPTELAFRDRQTFWADVFTEVLTYVIEAAAVAPGNKRVSSDGYDDFTSQMKLRAGTEQIDIKIEVDFPPILQQDVQQYLQALTTFTTQNGQALQLMNDGPTLYRIALTALGIDNVEEIVDIFYPKDGSAPTNREVKTYEAPKSPEEVELEKQEDAKKELEAIALQQRALAAAPTGNQPVNQGAAGADNDEKRSRGGPNAVARESVIEDPEFREELISTLTNLRREALAAIAGNQGE